MSERMITVTSGEGSDFKKEEMTETDFNAKYRKNSDSGLQTEYDENAEVSENEKSENAEATETTRRGRK